MASLDDRLAGLAFFAIDHGLQSVRGGGGALIPFVVSEHESDGRKLVRFATETLQKSQAEARRYLASLGADRAVLAWDGYVTIDGARTDAILVSAYAAGQDRSLILAQRYQPGTAAPLGNAALIGEEPPLRGAASWPSETVEQTSAPQPGVIRGGLPAPYRSTLTWS